MNNKTNDLKDIINNKKENLFFRKSFLTYICYFFIFFIITSFVICLIITIQTVSNKTNDNFNIEYTKDKKMNYIAQDIKLKQTFPILKLLNKK